jgi:ubiquinone biosynthesis protein COQ4
MTMTTQTATQDSRLASKPENIGAYRIAPLEALRAFKLLVEDKEDTVQVFKIVRALAGKALYRGYLRLLATPEGGRQAYLGEELADKLQDRDWLAGFAPGTVGARYREFIALRNLSAYGLAEESRKLGEADIDAAHPIAWFARRGRDVHDIWHVLTGYGTDALGEASVVAFTYAQTKNRGLGFLAAAAAFEMQRGRRDIPYMRAVLQGFRNGRKAAWLMPLDYEALFAMPLERARADLKISRPTIYENVPVEARNGIGGEHPAREESFGGWPSQA